MSKIDLDLKIKQIAMTAVADGVPSGEIDKGGSLHRWMVANVKFQPECEFMLLFCLGCEVGKLLRAARQNPGKPLVEVLETTPADEIDLDSPVPPLPPMTDGRIPCPACGEKADIVKDQKKSTVWQCPACRYQWEEHN